MGAKLLIIDDNEQDLKIIHRYFSQDGFEEIFLAETGEEALRCVKEKNPDIVVSDTNLPGMDGFEICKKIKEIKGNKSKIVIITGDIDVVDAVKAREMGADDYCAKTSDYAALLEAVQKLGP